MEEISREEILTSVKTICLLTVGSLALAIGVQGGSVQVWVAGNQQEVAETFSFLQRTFEQQTMMSESTS
jgi:hypothetical protein